MSVEAKSWDASIIIEALLKKAGQFELFQLIRLIEGEFLTNQQCFKSKIFPIGQQTLPEDEVLFFSNRVRLQFTTNDVSKLILLNDEAANGNYTLQLETPILGLLGILGALPFHYSELVNKRIKAKDRVLKEFLDLFQHRLLALYYRAWKKHHFFVGYENALQLQAPKYDVFGKMLHSFIGTENNHVQAQLKVKKEQLLFYSGLIARNIRSALALQQLLQHYLAMPVQITQFQGQWLRLKPIEQTIIGTATFNYNILGQDGVLGKRVWDLQSKFRIIIGPMNYDKLISFFPVNKVFPKLMQLIRLYVGLTLNFDCKFLVNSASIPQLQLNKTNQIYLGWNTWLKGINNKPHPAAVVLTE